jgi:hypothetical protein
MPIAHLRDRAILAVTGADAEYFLQNLVTTDLSALKEGQVLPGALLSPQGKILFDFLVSRTADGAFRLECRADVADDFMRRLMLYRLRAKVTLPSSGPKTERRPSVRKGWRMAASPRRSRGAMTLPYRKQAPPRLTGTPTGSPAASPKAAETMRSARLSHMTCCSTR